MAKGKKLTKAQRKKAGLPLYVSLAPQSISRDAWYYEERGKLHLVVWTNFERALSKGERVPVHVRIPWKRIEGSVRRMRAEIRAHARSAPGSHS